MSASPSPIAAARERLQKFQGQYVQIARRFDLSYSWVSKFAQGKLTNPTARNFSALQEALSTLEAEKASPAPTSPQ